MTIAATSNTAPFSEAPTPARVDPFTERLAALGLAASQQGDVVQFHRGRLYTHPDVVRDLLVTNDRLFTKSPALRRARFTLGNGLLTNEGETYRKQRSLIQPSLHPKRLAGYAGIMTRHAGAAAAEWKDGETIDLHREMMRLTLRIVGEALFGNPIGPEVDQISHAMDANVGMFKRLTSRWGPLKVLLPTPFTIRFLFARRRLVGTLRRFISDRRASGDEKDDLLSRLLTARDAEGGGAMTERQLIDECVTLFAAGHETSANALTFTLWQLAQHPDVMDRLAAEVDRVLPGGAVAGMEAVESLDYMRRVVAESMRLYPPAWIMGRQAKEACEIGGHQIRRGEVVFISQWLTHRDPRWWPEPLRFDPDRFLPENQGGRPRWAYFPFGGGSRLCVGESFAWAEVVLVLATIVQRWRMEWTGKALITLDPGITLRPGEPIRMTMLRR